ncbi:MAG: porin [Verrucomicrobiales bacterium]|nr:porin [Verrucomicrobiales bacterium]
MTQSNTFRNFVTAAGAAAVLAGGSSFAGDYGKVVIDDKAPIECAPDPAFCDIFDAGELYSGGGFVSSVSIVGRYHGQFQSNSLRLDSGENYNADYWEHRRLRLGTSIEFANGWEFFNNWNISDGQGSDAANEEAFEGDFWGSIDEMYLKGKISGVGIQIGKQKQKVTREFSTSSKRILTVERSHIVNEVADKKPWGVQFSGEAIGMKHKVGFWLGGYENDADGEGKQFPGFRDGVRGSISYNLEKELTDATSLFLDYVYTNNSSGLASPGGSNDESALSSYNHVVALGTESTWDIDACREWGLITDLIWGIDRESDGETFAGSGDAMPDGEDTFGVVLLGHYDITEKLELVGKYAYASTSRLQRPQRRDNRDAGLDIPRFNMEDVHTFYAGLNYRICGDNLKLMAGYEYLTGELYGTGNGITGDSWVLGIRTYF